MHKLNYNNYTINYSYMSWGHWHDDHGHGGGSGSNTLGECLFGHCTEVKWAAHGLAGMFYTSFLGIFDGGGGGGWWHHDHGHH